MSQRRKRKPQAKKLRSYVFTINNYTDDDLKELERISKVAKKLVAQVERGEEGTPHVQGVVQFKNPKTFATLKKQLPRAHIEKCKDLNAAIKYCCKEDTRERVLYRIGAPPEIEVISKLRPWQAELLRLLEKQREEKDDRTINWVYDEEGKRGKTAFSKWLMVKREKSALYVAGKAADVKYLIATLVEDDSLGDRPFIIWDCPRSMENYFSYSGVEQVKNGLFFSGKYESRTVCINSPIVIVFANFPPDTSKLSADRWNVIHLTDAYEEECKVAAEEREQKRDPDVAAQRAGADGDVPELGAQPGQPGADGERDGAPDEAPEQLGALPPSGRKRPRGDRARGLGRKRQRAGQRVGRGDRAAGEEVPVVEISDSEEEKE